MTKKTLYTVFFILCSTLLLSAVHPTRFKITGIKDDILNNVKTRLTELNKVKPLDTLSKTTLHTEIEEAMTPYGYFNPKVTIKTSKKALLIRIKKGPQTRITQVNITLQGEGSTNHLIKESIHTLDLKAGQFFNNRAYDEAKESLLNVAEHQGYLRASYTKAELRIDKVHNTSQVEWVFNTGPLYYFGQVQFDPTYICPELLHRYVQFGYGQPYSTDQVLALNSHLSASGYFKSVSVKPNINQQRYVPINIHLQPAKPTNYTFGIGFGTDTGPRGRIGYHMVPVNRAGHKFNIIGQASLKENALQAQYAIPGKNPVTDQITINGGVSSLNYNSGYANSYLASVAHQRTLPNYQHLFSLNALTERFHYNPFVEKTKQSMVYPKGVLTFKRTSNPLFSPTGFNITLTGLAASRAVLSKLSVAQAMIDVKGAIRFDGIRTRFYAHTIQGITNVNDVYQLPLSLALLLGGSNDMKAYSFNSIGPGKRITYGGLELQKETIDNWYFVIFGDTGDVYRPLVRNLQNDVGIGLMWVSPVGPVKVSIAQAVTKQFDRRRDYNPRLVINVGPDL